MVGWDVRNTLQFPTSCREVVVEFLAKHDRVKYWITSIESLGSSNDNLQHDFHRVMANIVYFLASGSGDHITTVSRIPEVFVCTIVPNVDA